MEVFMKKAITISIIIAIILALTVSVVVYLCVREDDDKKGPEEDKIYENISDVDITIEDIEKLTLLDFPETSELKYAMNCLYSEDHKYNYCNLPGRLMVRIDTPTEDTEEFFEYLKEIGGDTTSENDSDEFVFENTPHTENVRYKDAYKSFYLGNDMCNCTQNHTNSGVGYEMYVFRSDDCTTFYINAYDITHRDI